MRFASRQNPWVGVTALVGVMAAWMAGGPFHIWHSSDSLIPILVSLQRWTPFYWAQDRYGMLVPLLAIPVRDPLMNLLLQGWVMTVAGLLAPFLMARCVTSDPHRWFIAGATANLLLLALAQINVQFDWLVVQPYGLSLSLAAVAIVIAQRPGRFNLTASVVLMVLAHWVNLSVFVVIGAMILLRRPLSWRALASATIGVTTGDALTSLTDVHTPSTLLSPREWPHAWSQLLASVLTPLNHTVLFVIAVAATAGAIVLFLRRAERRAVEMAAVLLATGMVHWLVTGTSSWVQINLYFPRYLYPSVAMAALAVGIIASALLEEWRRWTPPILATALVALTIVDYGRPSLTALRTSLDKKFGAMTSDVLTSGAAVIGGDYWTVWPAVFHANLALYRQDRRAVVYALAFRSEITNPLWTTRMTDIRVAAAPGDRKVEGWMNTIPLSIERIEHHGTLDLFVTRTAAAARQ
ncbi:MAG TPA: hypothetical protein VGG73_22245 [Vicinamibacterales bacterium]